MSLVPEMISVPRKVRSLVLCEAMAGKTMPRKPSEMAAAATEMAAASTSAAQSSVAVWQQPDRYRLSSLSRGYWTNMNQTTINAGRFDVAKIAATLPETATTLLVDHYLTNREAASARVFRVYKPTPPHYHATCDEYLYVFSGRGTFWMQDESTSAEFGPGELLFFKRGTVHAQPKILEDPVVFLAIDTPRRDPKDIVFVNPEDGTPESFIRADQ
jgi:mannose-6-phosphate isomerase-like protein (cupin superfamily)